MIINTLFSAAVTTTAGSLAESAVEEITTLAEETTTGQMIEEVGAWMSLPTIWMRSILHG